MTTKEFPAELPPSLNAPCLRWDSPSGGLAMYYANRGDAAHAQSEAPPMLLLHSVNAAGSAAEMAPLFEHYRTTRAVYALDLPGFGHSERADRVYSPRVMTDAVIAALEQIAQRHGETPVDVVALSLATEFAARAQVEQPHRIRRLAMISPTGLRGKRRYRGAPGSTRGVARLYALLANPLWSDGLYRTLTRPGVVRYFLQRSWGSKTIDEALWKFDVQTARQPGAKHAPLFFLSAYLFSADITNVYESVDCPVWVSMATRGDFTDYRGRDALAGHANWQFHTVDGGALPHFEDGAGFMRRLDPFWA